MNSEMKIPGKPALSGDYDKYVELLNSINESDRRSLLTFMQTFNTFELYKAILLYYNDLHRYEDHIKPLKDLLTSYMNLKNHFTNNKSDSMHFVRLPSYAPEPRSKDYAILTGDLRKKGIEYRKWITEVVKAMSNNSSNVIWSGVNKEGLHYKAAIDMVEHLSRFWFIKKITLFGSVARGEERSKSDIDLAVDMFPELSKARTTVQRLFRGIIDDVVDRLQEKYCKEIPNSKLFNILCTNLCTKKTVQMFEMTGFFDKSIVLYEKTEPAINIIHAQTVNIDEIYGVLPYVYSNGPQVPNIYYTFFEPITYQGKYGRLCKTKVVKYHNNEIIYFGIVQLPVGNYAGGLIETALSIIAVNDGFSLEPDFEAKVLKANFTQKFNAFKII